MKPLLLLILRGYKLAISPMLGQNCRFYPSCSEYAMEAIREYGAAKGSLMAGKRLCKCHPWHPGGIDLVPPKSEIESALDGDEKSASAPTSSLSQNS
ncbi:membrane protein insertion efficiency factor YidD [Undibacterium danionis]|uniref:Putative membrane protein insertion efficiency factor n=1 Tax=Undibacterium danionis TaxID=1812100 RepID=A0ABV6IHB2_9BURK